MGARVLPTVQMLSEIVKQKRRGGEMNRETPRNKDGKAQEHNQGIRERSRWCSSRRVLVQLTESAGWWIGDNDSLGVEISIAGGVRKMVRDPTPRRLFSFFFFFYIMRSLFLGTGRFVQR